MWTKVRSLFHNETLRKCAIRIRLPLGVLGIVALILCVRAEWFLPGLAVSGVGAVAQLWCFGCIKTRKILAVNGPYRFVRNPMYLSRMLLVLGVVLMTGYLWLVLLLSVLYIAYMVSRVEREEKHLKGKFGEDYVVYCRKVPRFMPVFTRVWPAGRTFYFNPEYFRRNHGLVNLLAVVAVYGVLYAASFWLTGCLWTP